MGNLDREEIMQQVNHRIGIAWEQFEGQFKLIAELLQSGLERLERRIDSVETKLTKDIEFTQQVIRTVNDNLTERINQLDEKIDSVDTKMDAMNHNLSAQIRENRMAIGRLESRFDELDQRTSRNERQILKIQNTADLG
ncbi:MAG: hypothetical protein HY540_02340 [Deltaproteobacteria bacterium]|nr:hypothetical protein [Deltaproteobacteria bacterium]